MYEEAKQVFFESDNTIAKFEHANGGWGVVSFFESMGLYYANPMDNLRSGCYSRHFKTKAGAIRYMKRHGFVEC